MASTIDMKPNLTELGTCNFASEWYIQNKWHSFQYAKLFCLPSMMIVYHLYIMIAVWTQISHHYNDQAIQR